MPGATPPPGRARRIPPRFSIVVPTCRRTQLLKRALASARIQTFQNFELLVVDDGAEEATRRLAAATAAQDARIRYLPRAVRGGVAAARNTGIEQAVGRWVTFLDDDDELLPGMLERVAACIDRAPEPIGFLWCGIRMVRDSAEGEELVLERRWGDHVAAPRPRPSDRRRRELDAIRIGCGFGLTVRRSLLEEIGGFDPSLPIAEETDLVLRLLSRGVRFTAIAEPLVTIHRVPGASLSNTTPPARRVESVQRLLARNREALTRRPHLAAKLWESLGREHLRAGDARRAWHVALATLARHPLRWPSWRMLLRAAGSLRSNA